MESFIQHWTDFDLRWAAVIFVTYIIVDAMYAQYTLHVVQYKPYSAATISALMHFILAFGVLNYVNNYLYIVPIAMGSWVGTFMAVKRGQRLNAV